MSNAHRYVLSDAGQSASAPYERNDCSVRAIVHATGITYAEAHDIMARAGRKPRSGGRTLRGLCILAEESPWRFTRNHYAARGITLAAWLRAYPTGTHILISRTHAFTVRDGTIYDGWKPGMRTRIIISYMVTQEEAQ